MAEEIVNLKFLIKLELKGESHVLKWCMKNNLIPVNVLCPKCGQRMRISTRNDSSDGYMWQCRILGKKNPHSITRSVRKGSWFYESRLPVCTILKIMYMWFQRVPHMFIKSELCVSDRTIIDWKTFCRKICYELCRRENGLLGGPGVVVEIGEKRFIKDRPQRGCHVDGKFVIGGIERGKNKCFLKVIEKQTKQILLSNIKENILPGSVVVSDCWKSYNCLSDKDFVQLKINDGFVLKNPEGRADTNTIEKEFVAIKKSLPAIREVNNYLEGHLAEYVWRKNNFQKKDFMSFLTRIPEIDALVSHSEDE